MTGNTESWQPSNADESYVSRMRQLWTESWQRPIDDIDMVEYLNALVDHNPLTTAVIPGPPLVQRSLNASTYTIVAAARCGPETHWKLHGSGSPTVAGACKGCRGLDRPGGLAWRGLHQPSKACDNVDVMVPQQTRQQRLPEVDCGRMWTAIECCVCGVGGHRVVTASWAILQRWWRDSSAHKRYRALCGAGVGRGMRQLQWREWWCWCGVLQPC